jgi:hypothetical protein
MVGRREVIAPVLGVGLGILFVVHPEGLARVSGPGRLPRDRGGRYGEETPLIGGWRRVAQAVGVACISRGSRSADTCPTRSRDRSLDRRSDWRTGRGSVVYRSHPSIT